jgi:hypothetical protein
MTCIMILSGKEWWRLSENPQANEAMNHDWFQEQGLLNLSYRYTTLK